MTGGQICYQRVYARARRLEGKVALITGGASGIGECTARLFVKHGARVVVADIQDEAGAALCAELGADAVASYVHCDVTVEADVAAAVDHAVARFGALDIMFNNAGIGGAACHSIRESTKEDFERVLSVNLVGPFLGTKHAARVMVPAGRGGCIIGTSSLASAVAGAASHAYTCAKRGLVALTENAAAELGRHGIRVNCVSPPRLQRRSPRGTWAWRGRRSSRPWRPSLTSRAFACVWRTSPPPCSTSPATTRGTSAGTTCSSTVCL